MASAKVLTMDGRELDPVELNDAVFDAAPNETMVHDVVVALRNAQRQGNAETKTRMYVSGGGAKPFKQKGTGRARQGSSREPQMKGGGVVWGPHKRSYRQDVPLRSRRHALRCVLSARLRAEALCVLDALTMGGAQDAAVCGGLGARLSGRAQDVVCDGAAGTERALGVA